MKLKCLILLIILLNVLLINCKKEKSDNPEKNVKNDSVLYSRDFIMAGDSVSYKYNKLKLVLDNITFGDLVPSKNSFSQTSSIDTPINIDCDSILDIRFGDYILYQNNYAVSKAFFVSNNYDNKKNIEFAVKPDKIINLQDSNYVVFLFNELDTINSAQKWISDSESQMYIVSLINSFRPYFDFYKGSNTIINKNENRKYIGLRRKVGANYVYGWLRVTINNCDKLDISGSSFSLWYVKIL